MDPMLPRHCAQQHLVGRGDSFQHHHMAEQADAHTSKYGVVAHHDLWLVWEVLGPSAGFPSISLPVVLMFNDYMSWKELVVCFLEHVTCNLNLNRG